MKKKYIQNTYTADIQIILKKDGRFERNVIFPHYVFNRATGHPATHAAPPPSPTLPSPSQVPVVESWLPGHL